MDTSKSPKTAGQLSEGLMVHAVQEISKKQRAQQVSLLVTKLPHGIHFDIFKILGPANQRILGATCMALYKIYQIHFKDEIITIHVEELPSMYRMPMYFVGSNSYFRIILDWIVPENIPLLPRTTKREPNDKKFLRKIYNDIKAGFKKGSDVPYDVENLSLCKGSWRIGWGGKAMLEIRGEASEEENKKILGAMLEVKIERAKRLARQQYRWAVSGVKNSRLTLQPSQ